MKSRFVHSVRLWKISLIGAASLLTCGAFADDKNDCESKIISMLVSPDDSWVVSVREETCSGEGFATTGITDTVQLLRPGEKWNHNNDIFAVEEHGDPLNRPMTQWLGPRKLQITVPNRSLIGLKKRRDEDVEIVIRYDPDDPADRARFLRELGLPPE
jgi:hypothetical protein